MDFKVRRAEVRLFGLILALLSLSMVALAQADDEVHDPLEPINRGIFWFNDKFDFYLLEPVARGYDWLMPDPMQRGVGNFFDNIRYPIFLISDLVQLKFNQMGVHTGRFLINSTVGVLGFIDVAKDWGLKPQEADFGLALGTHGIPEGPYLVLPILGPSNLRDGFGKIVDSFLHPLTWVNYSEMDQHSKNAIIFGGRALEAVDTRAGLLEDIETAKESAIDYYLFLQGAYHQHRKGLLNKGKETTLEDEEYDQVLEAEAKEEAKAAAEKAVAETP